ncbi:MAG: RNA-directed DNA polymerase, partial [Clostridia bacterium]
VVSSIRGIAPLQRDEFLQLALFGKFSGIGLGSQVSQLVELSVLDDLDHIIKERFGVEAYERYMDDLLMVDESKEKLQNVWTAVTDYMRGIGLELNRKCCIYPLGQGVIFLKWRFLLTDTGAVVRRKIPKALTKERRKLRKFKQMLSTGDITMVQIADSYQSWRSGMERGNTHEVLVRMDLYYHNLLGQWPPVKKKGAKTNGKCHTV